MWALLLLSLMIMIGGFLIWTIVQVTKNQQSRTFCSSKQKSKYPKWRMFPSDTYKFTHNQLPPGAPLKIKLTRFVLFLCVCYTVFETLFYYNMQTFTIHKFQIYTRLQEQAQIDVSLHLDFGAQLQPISYVPVRNSYIFISFIQVLFLIQTLSRTVECCHCLFVFLLLIETSVRGYAVLYTNVNGWVKQFHFDCPRMFLYEIETYCSQYLLQLSFGFWVASLTIHLFAQDFRFQFMNTVKVLEKPVSLTYVHAHGDNRTAMDMSVSFDPANKLTMSYAFDSGNCKVKYVYAHGEMRRTVIEPCYDVSKNVWDFALSRKFEGGDSIKATYQTSAKILGLEWNRDSKVNGCFKVFFFSLFFLVPLYSILKNLDEMKDALFVCIYQDCFQQLYIRICVTFYVSRELSMAYMLA